MNPNKQNPRDELEGNIDLNMLFSLRKPKDARAGLASGAKSVAKGVIAGTIGLFAAPAVGAHQEGFKGFAKGAAAGIAGAVILPVTGVAIGATQVVRGFANTREAVREGSKGSHWDEKQRTWVSTPGTALALPTTTDTPYNNNNRYQGINSKNNTGTLDSENYYAILGVPTTATPDQIKRAYYLAARRLHPDKNPDDPIANQKFQAVSQAYQVLGNEELRKRYDAHGAQGLDVNFVDGAAFFGALFGSDKFEHLIGELMLAAAARAGPDLNTDALKSLQQQREATLQIFLGALLRRWEEGDEVGFRESMMKEASDLAKASFGETMLHTIGKVYEVQATIYLGGILDGGFAALKAQGRTIKSQFKAASLALKVYQAHQTLARLDAEAQRYADEAAAIDKDGARLDDVDDNGADNDNNNDNGKKNYKDTTDHIDVDAASTSTSTLLPQDAEDRQRIARAAAMNAAAERTRAEEDALPLMLDAMWAANVLDIESTLRHVCRHILHDPSCNKATRKRRAEGLLQLGRIFKAAKAPETVGSRSSGGLNGTTKGGSDAAAAKRRMEEAMMSVVEKRMAAEDHM